MASDELTRAFRELKLTSPIPSEDDFITRFNNLRISRRQQIAPLSSPHHRHHHSKPVPAPAAAPMPSATITWAVGHSPLGPFAPFFHNHNHQQHSSQPRASGGYKPKYSIDNPSPYYLEQAPFYAPPTRSDPFAVPPSPSPSPSLFTILFALLANLLTTIRVYTTATARNIFKAIGYVAFLVLSILESVVTALTSREMGALVLASALVRVLPGWKREVAELGFGLGAGDEGSEPLYRIFLAGREALGTGSVRGGQF
ncbi:hypothetical protein VTL71DRAFT_2495 [Oculimacula yallundae]|uniref:Uncharacterized protein n=1 Tax=Oculimacula yallundae TaxID=86028 RepID=A0ABR4CB18_9HELO